MDTLSRPRAARTGADTQALLDALPVLVLGVDVAGRIAFANVAAAETLTAAAGGLVSRCFRPLAPAHQAQTAINNRASEVPPQRTRGLRGALGCVRN